MKQQKDALIELEIVWEDDLLTASTREHVRRAIVALSAAPEPNGWLAYVRYDLGGPDRAMIECDKERLLAALSHIGAAPDGDAESTKYWGERAAAYPVTDTAQPAPEDACTCPDRENPVAPQVAFGCPLHGSKPAAQQECTGFGASWCPIHGTCTCPGRAEIEGVVYQPDCPLHGEHSRHAEGQLEPAAQLDAPLSLTEQMTLDEVKRLVREYFEGKDEEVRDAAEVLQEISSLLEPFVVAPDKISLNPHLHGGGKMDGEKKGKGKGLDKEYLVTNPETGETRTVTQRQWRDEKLGQAGWEKPEDEELDEEPEMPETPGM